METQFEAARHCPVCGVVNPADATHCQNCEVNFAQVEERTPGPVGFAPRLGAYLIDGLVLFVPQLVLSVAAVFASAAGSGSASNFETVTSTAQCLLILVTAAYFIGFWAWRGQTPGKMALGIKVVKTDGSPVTFGTALVRYIGYWISALVLLLGFLWVLWDTNKQGWHDKIAGTYVVRA